MKLYPHQERALELSRGRNRVAYYHDMGLGKTYTGAAKLIELRGVLNLVICQHSKVHDWINHFRSIYPDMQVVDLTKRTDADYFVNSAKMRARERCVGVINYDLIYRRPALMRCTIDTMLLDESSVIQNEMSRRAKAVLKVSAKNVILLSGTPTGGRYEKLWSQCKLLGWDITKDLFWKQYVDSEWVDDGGGHFVRVVRGYKNTGRLKEKLAMYGAQFLMTNDVIDLPEQTFTTIRIAPTSAYHQFRKDGLVDVCDHEIIGANTLTKMLGERRLCGSLNPAKMDTFQELLDSTNGRLVVFYNFVEELEALMRVVDSLDRPLSLINGAYKDLGNYERCEHSVTLIQYQAGAMGLDLQKANHMVFFTPPLSSELFEQAKKRIHRIGQNHPCFYYKLIVSGSVEERIYQTLAMRRDYNENLFERGSDGRKGDMRTS